jgi:acyl-CoA dehydrogenase
MARCAFLRNNTEAHMTYRAPVETIAFTLDAIAGLAEDIAAGAVGDLTADMVPGIIEEAGRFAAGRLAPVNRQGDREGARLDNGVVTLPEGWPALYRDWAGAGWNGVDLAPEWGGMGLPTRLATVAMEFWTSACMGFALGPVLTQGAADTLLLHGSEALKATYLPKLVSGEWTATMNLTEPQAGSDLGALTTRAIPQGDGTYKLTGNKIFITYGEHDLTENILHLVLARLPDAPPGTKGISLFLVPKVLVNADGSLGARNDVLCAGIEHKLGIHASPTCAMVFGDRGGATGWLLGEENRGLACMFTMMNKARLFTGLQGVAIAERACQQALDYAKTRKQGRAQDAKPGQSSPIIAHPDVRRNLAAMRAMTAAARAVAYNAARAIDLAHASPDAETRVRAGELAGLLTPVTKAYCTDLGCEVTSIGIQIHGGMGYVEETGAAQHFRDARIAPIYEGTNGIQAIDLVLRKVLRPGSRLTEELIAEFRALGEAAEKTANPAFGALGTRTREAAEALQTATTWLRQHENDTEALLGAASPYLRLFGMAAGAAYLARGALAAAARIEAGETAPVLTQAISDARFFAETVAVMAPAFASIVAGNRVAPEVDFT